MQMLTLTNCDYSCVMHIYIYIPGLNNQYLHRGKEQPLKGTWINVLASKKTMH